MGCGRRGGGGSLCGGGRGAVRRVIGTAALPGRRGRRPMRGGRRRRRVRPGGTRFNRAPPAGTRSPARARPARALPARARSGGRAPRRRRGLRSGHDLSPVHGRLAVPARLPARRGVRAARMTARVRRRSSGGGRPGGGRRGFSRRGHRPARRGRADRTVRAGRTARRTCTSGGVPRGALGRTPLAAGHGCGGH